MHSIHWSPGVTLDHVERFVIEKAFDFYKRNKTATSAALGISIRTLDERLKKYEQDDESVAKRNALRVEKDRDFNLRQRGLHPTQMAARIPPMVEQSAEGEEESGSGESVSEFSVETDREEVGESEDVSDHSESEHELEPPSELPEESPVSVHVRKKVQSVPSRKSAARSSKRGR